MDIVLGVSMTPTTVRMVLVEGEKADGVTVDHDVFDINATEGSATSSAADQVVAAVLGTQESAAASGHHLKSIGVTWTHHSDAAALRDTLAARGVEDVMLVSATHAAAALAQAVGRAVGYDTTALLFIEKDTATLSVVQTDDGSVVKVLSRDLHDSDAMAVLPKWPPPSSRTESPPQGMFVVGSGVDVGSVKDHLENLVALPVSAPEEPELALARGAALASAHAPEIEASTAGLAYSQDPDGTTAGSAYPELASAATQLAPVGAAGAYRTNGPPNPIWIADYAELLGREPQAVPARRQCADVDLRGRCCGTGDFVGGQHPADGRSTAQPRRDSGHSQPGGAAPPPAEELVPAVLAAPAPAAAAPPPRKPSRRPCRWCSRPLRKRHGRCSSSSPRPGAGTRGTASGAGRAAASAARGAVPIPAPVPVYTPPVYNPPIYYPPRPPIVVLPPKPRSGFLRGVTTIRRW